MLPPKLLARFIILLAVFSALLMVVPWEGARNTYAGVFRTVGNVAFARFWVWGQGSVRFLDLKAPMDEVVGNVQELLPKPLPPGWQPLPPTQVLDTLMVLRNRKTPNQIGLVRTSARSLGYWPTAFFLALTLSKPLRWKRKGWALLWGLLLIHLFIVIRMTLLCITGGFVNPTKGYQLFDLSEFWMNVVVQVEGVLVHNPTVSFVMATLVWFIVAFTREDWASFRARAEALAEAEQDERKSA